MEVVTVQSDTVDAVMWRYLGTTEAIELVIAENRHLSKHGAVLPAGVRIRLPDAPGAPEPKKVVKLWD